MQRKKTLESNDGWVIYLEEVVELSVGRFGIYEVLKGVDYLFDSD